jgi:hypothetical protein
MEINMKVCGQWINVKDRAHTGALKARNLGESTQVTGLKTKNMVEEPFSIKMEIDMMDTGSMEWPKEKVV